MTDYNLLAKAANRRLQSASGAVIDGYWGNGSQDALNASGKQLTYDWDKLRLHFGRFTQPQVDGFNAVLDAINKYDSDSITPPYVAYMLATAWHETAATMQPIEEYGKGKGRPYGKRLDIHGGQYSSSLPIYYGRGYVQLTWLTNYVFMKNRLGVDFVNSPELALDPKHAADIMITGMLEGSFTGKSLSKYINYGLYFEFVNARRIINGTDKDKMIATYAVKFLDSLAIT